MWTVSNTQPIVHGRAFLSDREHKVSPTFSEEETPLSQQQWATEAEKVWEREKATRWRRLLSAVAVVTAGLWGGQGWKFSLHLSALLSWLYEKLSRSPHIDAQRSRSHRSSFAEVEHKWVIKVKSGHECRSCYRPTFQVHHPSVIRSSNTAGE